MASLIPVNPSVTKSKHSSMLNGVEKCVTEIQINRAPNINARGGYSALFDATAHESELIDFVLSLIETKNNVFSAEDVLHIFKLALNIERYDLFKANTPGQYSISDENLLDFLTTNPSMTSKSIFFLSTKLLLTDKDRKTICEITWNSKSINQYLNKIKTINYTPIRIKDLTFSDAKEDIITYASVELYKKIKCDLLAVSYPGAQGDRCILSGSGRTVLRDYIDIIAYRVENSKLIVFLEECKDDFRKSQPDVDKLNNIISSPQKMEGLSKLFSKTINNGYINDTKISVGSKITHTIPPFDVDYIFMFDIRTGANETYIDYSVAVIDTTLVTLFVPLLNNAKKLKGTLTFDKIYIID